MLEGINFTFTKSNFGIVSINVKFITEILTEGRYRYING